jgi:hypothetical protein
MANVDKAFGLPFTEIISGKEIILNVPSVGSMFSLMSMAGTEIPEQAQNWALYNLKGYVFSYFSAAKIAQPDLTLDWWMENLPSLPAEERAQAVAKIWRFELVTVEKKTPVSPISPLPTQDGNGEPSSATSQNTTN